MVFENFSNNESNSIQQWTKRYLSYLCIVLSSVTYIIKTMDFKMVSNNESNRIQKWMKKRYSKLFFENFIVIHE